MSGSWRLVAVGYRPRKDGRARRPAWDDPSAPITDDDDACGARSAFRKRTSRRRRRLPGLSAGARPPRLRQARAPGAIPGKARTLQAARQRTRLFGQRRFETRNERFRPGMHAGPAAVAAPDGRRCGCRGVATDHTAGANISATLPASARPRSELFFAVKWIPSTPAVATTLPASKNATFMKLASAL
jgi:hypothetical protein